MLQSSSSFSALGLPSSEFFFLPPQSQQQLQALTQEPEITWGGLPSPRPPSPRVNWGGAEDRCRYRAMGSAILVLASFGNKWFLPLHPLNTGGGVGHGARAGSIEGWLFAASSGGRGRRS